MVRDSACDLVVFGAAGFTGRLVAEYVVRKYGNTIKWGMAGRDLERLATVRTEIGASDDTLLIKADSEDDVSLRALVGRTRAVISTVGPVPALWVEAGRGVRSRGHGLSRPEWRDGLDEEDDRRA